MATYWSFKGHSLVFTTKPLSNSFSFFDYWSTTVGFGGEVPQLMFVLFTFQVLTLLFGLVSAFLKKRVMLIIPVSLSVWVLALMIASLGPARNYGTFQLGFYLVLPALAMFLMAFFLNTTKS
jgi:vacuolar-type H+-ATPase subunit I/STV1